MEIVVTGTITSLLPARTGVSQNNKSWVSQDFVMETADGQKLCFNVFGEKAIQNSGLRLHAEVCVVLDVVSRPSRDGDKYFTSINFKKGFVLPNMPKVDPQRTAPADNAASVNAATISTPMPTVASENPATQPAAKPKVEADDLPF